MTGDYTVAINWEAKSDILVQEKRREFMTRKMLIGTVLVGLVIVSGQGHRLFGMAAPGQAPQNREGGIPTFQVDPSWPQVPERWKLGSVSSVAVDAEDNVWVLHRPGTLPADEQAMAAPPVLQFGNAGNFIQGWGGPADGYEWPQTEHGIRVDHEGHVWIGGNGRADNQVLKFTKTGTFVMQIGRSNQSGGNSDTQNLKRPAGIDVYPTTNEVFIADGYGNSRVIVFDADTGDFKRMWGAFGNEPLDADRRSPGADPLQQFNTVHDVSVSSDGFVYVGDRGNKRVQVFTIDGEFVAEQFIAPQSVGLQSRAFAFSPDPEQQLLYVGGTCATSQDPFCPEISVLNRQTLEILGAIQSGAPSPTAVQIGQPHHIAIDSKGNLYTAETANPIGEGSQGVQKFAFEGLR